MRQPRIPGVAVKAAGPEDQVALEEVLAVRVVAPVAEVVGAEVVVADSAEEAGVEAAVAEEELARADAIL